VIIARVANIIKNNPTTKLPATVGQKGRIVKNRMKSRIIAMRDRYNPMEEPTKAWKYLILAIVFRIFFLGE